MYFVSVNTGESEPTSYGPVMCERVTAKPTTSEPWPTTLEQGRDNNVNNNVINVEPSQAKDLNEPLG